MTVPLRGVEAADRLALPGTCPITPSGGGARPSTAPARERRSVMPEPAAPRRGGIRAPLRPSANVSARPPPASAARRRPTRIARIRMGLIAGIGALILLVIFIVQNAHAVHITFFGAHASVSLAAVLIVAAIAGALVTAAAGTARVTQLRRTARRTRRRASPGSQTHVPASDPHRDRDVGQARPETRSQS